MDIFPRSQNGVLLAIGNEVTRHWLRMTLELAGYDVITANDAVDALTGLCLTLDPLVVVVGARMPDMPTEEMLNIVTQDSHLWAKHAFIVLADSGDGPSAALKRYLSHLGIPVLVTPLEERLLLEAMRAAEARRGATASAPMLPF